MLLKRGKSKCLELVTFTSASIISIRSFPDTGNSRDFVVRAVRNNICFFLHFLLNVFQALSEVERECQKLRKKLQYEVKLVTKVCDKYC